MKRTALFISLILLYGLLMAFNLADCQELGKKSDPGERLAPGHFMTMDGQIWDGDAMKAYFMKGRSPFKQYQFPDVKKKIKNRDCIEYRDPWRE